MEERQRAEKRQREASNQEFTPKWFTITGDITTTPWGDMEIYEYNGKYTEHRNQIEASADDSEVDSESTEFNPWQFNEIQT